MRVLFFVHRYWPSVGGVEKYIHGLSKALLSLGHEVHVVAGATAERNGDSGSRGPCEVEREVHEGVHIHRFPAQRSPLRARCWLLRNVGLFRRADVVHVSNTHMLEYYYRMFGSLIERRKVFLTRHGMSYLQGVPDWEKRRALRSLELAAGIVHDGVFIETWLGIKPDLCPDQGLSPPADDLEPVPEPPPNSAVFIGRLEPDSAIHIYLDAVRILTGAQGRDFRLNVYGDGSLGAELRDQAIRENLPVRFFGRTPDAQRHVVDSCFAFIDGRMAIQEAMARRRLVLAGYMTPIKRDYVGGEPFSPYLVPVASGAELAEKVAYYIDHPGERLALVARAFEHARTLTWRRTARAYLNLWQERLTRPERKTSRWELLRLARILSRESRMPKAQWATGAAEPTTTQSNTTVCAR